jgi:hypothetical protein
VLGIFCCVGARYTERCDILSLSAFGLVLKHMERN